MSCKCGVKGCNCGEDMYKKGHKGQEKSHGEKKYGERSEGGRGERTREENRNGNREKQGERSDYFNKENKNKK